MSKYPEVFSSIYVNMVRAGETSGMLGEVTGSIHHPFRPGIENPTESEGGDPLSQDRHLSLTIAFAVLLAFVIPRFAQIFAQFKTPLPLPTRIMIGINTLFQNYWYLVLIVAFGIPILLRRYLRTESGRYSLG